MVCRKLCCSPARIQKGVVMARAEPPEGPTKWMVALYAMPGLTLVLTLLAFAAMGYAFAARFLVMAAVLSAGLGAWYLATRSTRRRPFVGLVIAVHLLVVAALPALAFTVFPKWVVADEYAGASLWTIPAAAWYGALMSLGSGIWEMILGRRFWRQTMNDPDRLS